MTFYPHAQARHTSPQALARVLALAVFAILPFWMGVALANGNERVIGADLTRFGYPICEGEE